MVNLTTLLGIVSIGIGFFLFMGSFLCYYYEKPRQVTWTLFGVAIVFLTVIPVTLAVFFASVPSTYQ
ncbi:hypothetical protein ACFPVT_02875 [Corynebacterium choanae]|uniref:Uncharacterized protein n=1 Tax=Corynebacterium choanae TaxID=1862358 RepID=A0A3G6J337_9CORY|nr:hypothetical protein [Corynebacterium choanae]AZA12481.1 hypothetical protein CCHOA_00245 [Corynebacterium choanae]